MFKLAQETQPIITEYDTTTLTVNSNIKHKQSKSLWKTNTILGSKL